MYKIAFVGFILGVILIVATVLLHKKNVDTSRTSAEYPPVIDLSGTSTLSTVSGSDGSSQFFLTSDSGYLYKSQSDEEGAAQEFIAKDPEVTNENVQGASTINAKKITRKLFPKSIAKHIVLNRKKVDSDGTVHLYFTQKLQNTEVFGSALSVHIHRKKEIYAVIGNLTNDESVGQQTILKEKAEELALSEARQINRPEQSLQVVSSIPGILNPNLLDRRNETMNHPTQEVIIASTEPIPSYGERFIVALDTGRLLYRESIIHDVLNRKIYDCDGLTNDCPVARTEGSSVSGRADADSDYNYLGDIYNFYKSSFQRDSYDNAGASLISFVNVTSSSLGCPNAAWIAAPYNQLLICPHMVANDVVAHEFTHAVTEHTAQLITTKQSGALNEATSDIMAYGIDPDWQMGEDSSLGVIRDASDPTRDRRPRPDRLFSPNYYCGSSDSGGVHDNMTVITKTFYLMVTGGTFNGCPINGVGMETAHKVWYRALSTYFTSTANFGYAYISVLQACHDLYGVTADQCNQIQKAFQATEVDQQPANVQDGPLCSGLSPHAPVCAVQTPTSTNTPTPTPTPTLTPTILITSTPAPCALKLKGDVDCNNIIDLVDFEVWRKEFTKALSTKQADFNSDGVVNIVDFEIWRKGKFGS